MVVEVGNQFLDHDAQPRKLVIGQPLRLPEFARRIRRLIDCAVAPQSAKELVWI